MALLVSLQGMRADASPVLRKSLTRRVTHSDVWRLVCGKPFVYHTCPLVLRPHVLLPYAGRQGSMRALFGNPRGTFIAK
eukprot:362746-Chlamydomonas_euryale.AAC.4